MANASLQLVLPCDEVKPLCIPHTSSCAWLIKGPLAAGTDTHAGQALLAVYMALAPAPALTPPGPPTLT
jgi:hypothetical protein